MLGDHLGGTSLVNDANGQNAIETRYKAWGEVRYSSDQKVGVRFTGVNIPPDATIQNAWIQFTVDNAAADATALTIQAEANDNPGTFTSSSNNISSRTRTTASVAWTPVAWNTADEGGPDQRTPNLASVLQEIVERPGWSEGNAIVFILTGSGKRVAKSYNGDVYGAPYLHIEYTLPTSPTPTTLTIDYTYDALHRLTGATYSDGRTFDYTYDAAGNVLELQQNLGPGTVTTVYNYDAANQLNTAQQGSTTWQYTYDANGSLISDGTKTYTYDSANRLVQVNNQSVMTNLSYNGLGQRLSMDAAGVIAHYVMDGDQPLSAESAGNTTFYLYGLGTVAEKTNAWAYSLPDGTNTPRQLSNGSGEITLSARYTPWGDTLELNGTGSFAFGYFGGVMDAATGLIYVGNGQYYDPQTGRFLTRDAKPNNSNPYVPLDPSGAIIAPLGIIALFAGRKKKGSKLGTFLVLLLVLGSVGMTLAACGGGGSTQQSSPTPVEAIVHPISSREVLVIPITSGTPGTPFVIAVPPNITPEEAIATACRTPTIIPTPTPTGTPTPGIPAPTFFVKEQLSSVVHELTGLNAQMIYDHYLYLWNWQNHTGWWWTVYGRNDENTEYDADGFSFWDYIALYINHEAEYHYTDFVDDMAEAGVRFWYQRVKEGRASGGEYGFVDWWASFSQSISGDVKSNSLPDQHSVTNNEYKAFSVAADKFREPDPSWTLGQDRYRPYGWGNRSAYELHSNNRKVGEMLNLNGTRKPIIFRYIPGGDPFFVPSGCAAVNWIDNSDANRDTAWNPNVCDYLLNH